MAGEGGTDVTGQAIEDRGAPQEGAHRLGFAGQHLGADIVGHVAGAAGQQGRGAGGTPRAGVARGQTGQLEPGDPAFGPRCQGRGGLGGQRQVHGLAEKGSGLGAGEAQVALANLGHLVAGPQSGQGQRRVLAGAHHQVQARRLVFQQKGHQIMHGKGPHQVIIVQHQGEIGAGGGQSVDGGHQASLGRDLGRAARIVCCRLARPQQGGGQVAHKAGRVVVAASSRESQATGPGRRRPRPEQGGLAKTRRRRYQGQPPAQAAPLIDLGDEPGARHQIGPRGGHIEFGEQKRLCGHLVRSRRAAPWLTGRRWWRRRWRGRHRAPGRAALRPARRRTNRPGCRGCLRRGGAGQRSGR